VTVVSAAAVLRHDIPVPPDKALTAFVLAISLVNTARLARRAWTDQHAVAGPFLLAALVNLGWAVALRDVKAIVAVVEIALGCVSLAGAVRAGPTVKQSVLFISQRVSHLDTRCEMAGMPSSIPHCRCRLINHLRGLTCSHHH
jgi:hypothetical protein